MTIKEWAERKVCTSKSMVEAEDEAKRGCEYYSGHGFCKCCCARCPIETALVQTKNYLDAMSIKVDVTINITINGKEVVR